MHFLNVSQTILFPIWLNDFSFKNNMKHPTHLVPLKRVILHTQILKKKLPADVRHMQQVKSNMNRIEVCSGWRLDVIWISIRWKEWDEKICLNGSTQKNIIENAFKKA